MAITEQQKLNSISGHFKRTYASIACARILPINYDVSFLLPFQIPCVVFLLCVVLVVRYKWRRDADPRPPVSSGCTSCQLIEMGEMVCLVSI